MHARQARRAPCSPPRSGERGLKRAQKAKQVLRVRLAERVEFGHDRVGFGARTGVGPNSLYQVRRAAIVQEKQALPYSPQRGGSELGSASVALTDSVGKCPAHVVQGK